MKKAHALGNWVRERLGSVSEDDGAIGEGVTEDAGGLVGSVNDYLSDYAVPQLAVLTDDVGVGLSGRQHQKKAPLRAPVFEGWVEEVAEDVGDVAAPPSTGGTGLSHSGHTAAGSDNAAGHSQILRNLADTKIDEAKFFSDALDTVVPRAGWPAVPLDSHSDPGNEDGVSPTIMTLAADLRQEAAEVRLNGSAYRLVVEDIVDVTGARQGQSGEGRADSSEPAFRSASGECNLLDSSFLMHFERNCVVYAEHLAFTGQWQSLVDFLGEGLEIPANTKTEAERMWRKLIAETDEMNRSGISFEEPSVYSPFVVLAGLEVDRTLDNAKSDPYIPIRKILEFSQRLALLCLAAADALARTGVVRSPVPPELKLMLLKLYGLVLSGMRLLVQAQFSDEGDAENGDDAESSEREQLNELRRVVGVDNMLQSFATAPYLPLERPELSLDVCQSREDAAVAPEYGLGFLWAMDSWYGTEAAQCDGSETLLLEALSAKQGGRTHRSERQRNPQSPFAAFFQGSESLWGYLRSSQGTEEHKEQGPFEDHVGVSMTPRIVFTWDSVFAENQRQGRFRTCFVPRDSLVHRARVRKHMLREQGGRYHDESRTSPWI